MLMFLVTGQHLIVEGLLEEQIQDHCHPYEEFRRETIFHSYLQQHLFLYKVNFSD